MQYKPFKDGICLSRLGMGNMRLPQKEENGRKVIDTEKANALIDACYKAGINYYDTALIYHGGKSESFIGKALSAYPRDTWYIADKYNVLAMPDYTKQFPLQLERLGVDRIDFYLIHGIQDNFVDEVLTNGCIEYFDKMKKEGKIRYFGFSYHGNEANLLRCLNAYDFDFVQIQLNYYDWEYGNQRRLYEILEERGIPVMVMEPVHGGLLSRLNPEASAFLRDFDPSSSAASFAMRFVMSLPGVQVVLSGMNELSQLEDNVKTFSENREMSKEEKAAVKKAAELLRKDVPLPCTGCRYCVPNCPMGLEIPELLIAYNEFKGDHVWRLNGVLGLPKDKQPSACIGCASCTAHCPQSLDVPAAMREMAEALENAE